MATNLPAVDKLVSLFLDAFNDSANAFGQGGIKSFASFANLLPDVMGVIQEVGDLPNEMRNLQTSDLDDILAGVEQRLQIPNQKASAIVKAVLSAVGGIMDAATSAGTEVEKVLANHAG